VTGSAAFEVKGWCPGALRPMQSGDGLIVRVRPHCATLTPHELRVLGDAAQRFGNGHIDLTRRANLQIRGVTEASLPSLHAALARLGLLDANADSEAVRNIMINPLAGIDPTEARDIRPVARDLAQYLASEKSLWALPTKFGFIVDGGGALSLAAQRADVRLVAHDDAIAVGIDTRAGTEWLGSASPDAAAAVAAEIGLAFINVTSPGKRERMRDLPEDGFASIRSAMRSRLDPLHDDPPRMDASSNRPIGLIEPGANGFAVGIAAPFGRIESNRLRKLADNLAAHGIEEIRLSPWRALYVGVSSQQAGQSLLDAADRDGLITGYDDPLLQIEACPGVSGCRSTVLDTRGDGRLLAALLPRFGFTGAVHVSGCAKGCAKSGHADLVLVGSDGRYGIVRDGTAGDHPARSFTFAELAADPVKIFGIDAKLRA
jgi:precorrin-3B synthase